MPRIGGETLVKDINPSVFPRKAEDPSWRSLMKTAMMGRELLRHGTVS